MPKVEHIPTSGDAECHEHLQAGLRDCARRCRSGCRSAVCHLHEYYRWWAPASWKGTITFRFLLCL